MVPRQFVSCPPTKTMILRIVKLRPPEGKHRSQSLSHLSAVCIQWIRAVNDHGDNDFHKNLQLCFLSPSSRPFPSHHPSTYNPLNHSSPQHPPPRLDFPSQPSTPCIFSPTVLAPLMDFCVASSGRSAPSQFSGGGGSSCTIPSTLS